MGADNFEDLGPIMSSFIFVVDSHPSIECINIGTPKNHEYQLNLEGVVILTWYFSDALGIHHEFHMVTRESKGEGI